MAFGLPGLPSSISKFTPGADIGLALGVVLIVAVLIVPLPGMLLDFGLSVSITMSVLILMVAIFLRRPLDLSSFPTMLLLTTLLVIAHPTPAIGPAGSLAASTKRMVSNTEARLAFAVLTTERKAA